jgi:hypothetical protein
MIGDAKRDAALRVAKRARWKGERRRSSAKNPLHDPLLMLQDRREGDQPDRPCVGIDPILARHAIIGRLAGTGMFRPEGSLRSCLSATRRAPWKHRSAHRTDRRASIRSRELCFPIDRGTGRPGSGLF